MAPDSVVVVHTAVLVVEPFEVALELAYIALVVVVAVECMVVVVVSAAASIDNYMMVAL